MNKRKNNVKLLITLVGAEGRNEKEGRRRNCTLFRGKQHKRTQTHTLQTFRSLFFSFHEELWDLELVCLYRSRSIRRQSFTTERHETSSLSGGTFSHTHTKMMTGDKRTTTTEQQHKRLPATRRRVNFLSLLPILSG